MLLNKFACPHCQGVTKYAKGIEAGKKIRCPKCREPFTVTAAEDRDEEERVQAVPFADFGDPKHRSDSKEDVDEQQGEGPRRRRKKKTSDLILLCVLGEGNKLSIISPDGKSRRDFTVKKLSGSELTLSTREGAAADLKRVK